MATTNGSQQIQKWALVIIAFFQACFIPWAFVMERRLAAIETRVNAGIPPDWFLNMVKENKEKYNELDKRVDELEKAK